MKMETTPGLKVVKTEPSQFATEFSEVCCKVLSELYDLKNQQFSEDVKNEMKKIRRVNYSFFNKEGENFFVDYNFGNIATRCAYVYSYGVLDMSATYREFSKHLEGNKHFIIANFSNKPLKICCLAGGSGLEAVAVIKAIHNFLIVSNCEEWKNSVTEVNFTVVDICKKWVAEQIAVIKALVSSNLFHSKNIQITTDFLEADLLKPFGEKLQKIINSANIVTVVKFVNYSNMRESSDCTKKLRQMTQNIIQCMSDNSCLFMLDTAGGKVFNRIAEVICVFESEFTRQMIAHKAYRLHPKTLQELEKVMNFRYFPLEKTLFPTQLTRVSSYLWFKMSVAIKYGSVASEKKTVTVGKKPVPLKTKPVREKTTKVEKKSAKMKKKPVTDTEKTTIVKQTPDTEETTIVKQKPVTDTEETTIVKQKPVTVKVESTTVKGQPVTVKTQTDMVKETSVTVKQKKKKRKNLEATSRSVTQPYVHICKLHL